MRLIDTQTLELKEFYDGSIPPYAILSHTWAQSPDRELTFQEMESMSKSELYGKSGYKKIQQCCSQALKWGLKYAWVDTTCIDKSSSAELSEAINSMFSWYQNSTACLVLLSDVSCRPADSEFWREFKKSRWFTRGWCIQELLAPSNVQFFNESWTYIGSKFTLRDKISSITNIDENDLFSIDLFSISVARKMSWAAKRQTTRSEDIAYCLLGIFNIHMPLLYGEGEQAFIRLQEEIMKQTDDHSIFLWEPSNPSKSGALGVLARHPSSFLKYSDVELHHGAQEEPASVTSKGIRIQLPLVSHEDGYIALLSCHREGNSTPSERSSGSAPLRYLGLPLQSTGRAGVFTRTPAIHPIQMTRTKASIKTIYLAKSDMTLDSEEQTLHQCWIRSIEMAGSGYRLSHATPSSWDMRRRILVIRQWWATTDTALAFTSATGHGFALLLHLNPSDRSAKLRFVKLEHKAEASSEDMKYKLLDLLRSSNAKISRDRLFLTDQTVSANVEVSDVRGRNMFVVDICVY